MPPAGLHGALILSQKPHARRLSINDSGAKSSPVYAGIFIAKDVPGDNMIGPVIFYEELFATEFVTCVGQVMAFLLKYFHLHRFSVKNGKDAILLHFTQCLKSQTHFLKHNFYKWRHHYHFFLTVHCGRK